MYNNFPNNNSYTGISTINTHFYAKDVLTPIFPMKSYTDNRINEIMSIGIKTTSGFHIFLSLPGNTTVNDMIKKYLDKLQLPYSLLGKKIKFIYNGNFIDPFSQLPIFSTFRDGSVITTFELRTTIGGII